MARHSLRLSAALAMVTSVLSTTTFAQAPAPAPATTITLGQVGLSFYAVVGGVVQEVLERDGYTVLVIQGPHAEIFPRLGTGEVEIFAADIKAYEGQTLAGGFVQILLLYADVAHLFAKGNRSRAALERLAQERKRLVRRTVFNEQIGIEKDGFKGYLGKRDRGLRSSNLFHMRSGGMNKNVQHL